MTTHSNPAQVSANNHTSLADFARAVLATKNARDKASLALNGLYAYAESEGTKWGSAGAPVRPERPQTPELLLPGQVPRRKITAAPEGRIALLHALAHIELNAIDLAFDILARFAEHDMPDGFYTEWLGVGRDEARHFLLLDDRLREMDSHYGAMPAHDGLWEASQVTAHDLAARLAIVPMVLEARGLDVTPAMVTKLHRAGDERSAEILQIIHDDEITHVAVGTRWFNHLCDQDDQNPEDRWQTLVREYFKGQLKPPFNQDSRDKAGLTESYYAPWLAVTRKPAH